MTGVLRTIVIEPSAESRAVLRRMLGSVASVSLTAEFATIDEASRAITALRPDVVLADVQGESSEPIDHLTRVVPGAAIVAMVSAASSAAVVRLMRAGAFGFLTRPLDLKDLVAVLDKLARFRRSQPGHHRATRMTAVFCPKGGLGVSSVAVNVAVSLAARAPGSTILVELGRYSDAVTLLDLRPRYSIVDALENIDRMDESFLQGLLVAHSTGLTVLPGPARMEQVTLRSDRVQAALEIVRTQFAHVVVDLGHDLEGGTIAALELADTILFLTAPTVAALRAGAAALAAFRQLGLESARLRVVLMRDGTGDDVGARQVEEALGLPVAWKIPNDYRTAVTASNAGRPLVVAAPRSRVADNLRRLAESVDGRPVDHASAPRRTGFGMAWPKALRRTG